MVLTILLMNFLKDGSNGEYVGVRECTESAMMKALRVEDAGENRPLPDFKL